MGPLREDICLSVLSVPCLCLTVVSPWLRAQGWHDDARPGMALELERSRAEEIGARAVVDTPMTSAGRQQSPKAHAVVAAPSRCLLSAPNVDVPGPNLLGHACLMRLDQGRRISWERACRALRAHVESTTSRSASAFVDLEDLSRKSSSA